jgi:hypothetical protein
MTLRRLSPSAIGTFKDLCERRWYFAKVLGVVEPPNPRAESGTRMHKILEDWLRFGAVPPVDPSTVVETGMALASISALPAPQYRDRLIVEEHIEFGYGECAACEGRGCETCEGTGFAVLYHGYPDLRWLTADYDVVHDHKSTSNLRWAKTEEDLVWDAQRIVYGYPSAVRGRDVLSRWQYVETQKTRGEHATHLVEVFSTALQGRESMAWLHEEYGARMARAYDEPENARPQNPAACGKFGKQGCPYQYRCQIDPAKRMRQIMHIDLIRARMERKRREMEVTEAKPPEAEPVTRAEPPEAEPPEAEPPEAEPPEAETSKLDGPRTPPKKRKPRSDKGQPRGSRRKSSKDEQGEDTDAAAGVVEHSVPQPKAVAFNKPQPEAVAFGACLNALGVADNPERVVRGLAAYYGLAVEAVSR